MESFGTGWELRPEERRGLRVRFWIGFALYMALWMGVAPWLRRWEGHLHLPRQWADMVPSAVLALLLVTWQKWVPTVKQEQQRRALHLKIDADGYTGYIRPGVIRKLTFEEVTGSLRTPSGGLWLVTKLRRRRIQVPRDFPDLGRLRQALAERGVPELAASRWVLWYLMPAIAGWVVTLTSVGALVRAEDPRWIVAGWVGLTAMLAWQIVEARRDTAYEANGLVAIGAVGVVIESAVAAFRLFVK